MDGTAVSTACEDPELACQWLDYLYTYDGTLLINYGVEGEGMTFDAQGNPCYTDLVLNNPDGMITVACSLLYSKTGGAGIYDPDRYNASYSDQQLDSIALWTENVDNSHMYPTNIPLTADESSTIASLLTDIETYVKQMSLSCISGTASPQDTWDEFHAALTDMDVETVVQIYQDAYDRYASAMESAG